jgi:hypothetical protein
MFSPQIEPKHHIFLIDVNQHFFSILSLIHNDISIMFECSVFVGKYSSTIAKCFIPGFVFNFLLLTKQYLFRHVIVTFILYFRNVQLIL